jgi:hypothetical protein
MSYVSASLRRLVIERAGNCCEYGLLAQTDNPFSFHIEHIKSVKHGGETTSENMCLSCPDCNAFKGSDIASEDPETGQLAPLFNPTSQNWSEHFSLLGNSIKPLTAVGRVTVFLLRMNIDRRVAERTILIRLNRYPCREI